ncbi:hypothetical protein V5N11_024746 [Cardamine amara subsp. amara]|uniref:Uncharacterized protein n=1 Tax=Cardamine amara subsp. amara TaxID=228776 RepID=A0ABD0ZQT0_CARAN
MEIPPSPSPATPLRRRNSISTLTALTTPENPFDIDLELISLKPSSFVAYTSLRDIISSPINSSLSLTSVNGSSSPGGSTVGDISIRNRLVKQAALSYLSPTALTSSEESPGSHFLRRMWLHFSAGIQFLRRVATGEP